MAEHDGLSERGKALEEEYFKRRDRELVEKIRRAADAERDRTGLREQTGLDDPALLQELQDLGFTPETVVLLPLIPLVQVAWVEGGVTAAEKELIVQLARSRGVTEDSAADRLLGEWMASRPHDLVFTRATRLIQAMLASGGAASGRPLSAADLVDYCERIASASGGILGIGRVSAEERALLASIAADLEARHS